jgi:uncharacterized membrane protein
MADVQFLDLSPEEAFKIILSGGNYVPRELAKATADRSLPGGLATV